MKFKTLTNKVFTKNASTYKSVWEKAQKEGYDGLSLEVFTVFKKADENKFHSVFSTATEDRHGDIVEQKFDLKAYKSNPVFLDSHNYGSIEHIIGKVHSIGVRQGKLQGDIEFATSTPKGYMAMKLAEDGFLNTTSIGFIPKDFDKNGNITKSELLEISAVSVPANAEALFEKIKKSDDVETKDVEEETEEEVEEQTEEKTEEEKEAEAVKEEFETEVEESEEEEAIEEETPEEVTEQLEDQPEEKKLDKNMILKDVLEKLNKEQETKRQAREELIKSALKELQKNHDRETLRRKTFKSLRALLKSEDK